MFGLVSFFNLMVGQAQSREGTQERHRQKYKVKENLIMLTVSRETERLHCMLREGHLGGSTKAVCSTTLVGNREGVWTDGQGTFLGVRVEYRTKGSRALPWCV